MSCANKSHYFYSGLLLLACFYMPLRSTVADVHGLDYAQWKAKQLKHDQRLRQQAPHTLTQRVVQVQPLTAPLTVEKTPQVVGTELSLNVNTASPAEMMAKLEGIGPKKAQAIVDYRAQHGAFQKLSDLLKVKGIGEKTVQKNRQRIRLKD